jgi:hypothetical protein
VLKFTIAVGLQLVVHGFDGSVLPFPPRLVVNFRTNHRTPSIIKTTGTGRDIRHINIYIVNRDGTGHSSHIFVTTGTGRDIRHIYIVTYIYCHIHIVTYILSHTYCHIYIVTYVLSHIYCHIYIVTYILSGRDIRHIFRWCQILP